MPSMSYDAILIGAGVNGLVAAAYLARAGLRVLVLESRSAVGGTTSTEEAAPGFHFESCEHDIGWISPTIVKELGLGGASANGSSLDIVRPDPSIFAPPIPMRAPALAGSRGHLLLQRDVRRTADAIRVLSPSDADKWPAFTQALERMSGFLESVYASPAPRATSNEPADLLLMAGHGRRLRALGKKGMVELLRTVPMSAAELLDDWFENDLLKGTIGASGITGVMQGPRSSGTAFVLLHNHVGFQAARDSVRQLYVVRGGSSTLARLLADVARRAGADVRVGAEVASIVVVDGRATGVELANGERIGARVIASGASPRRTFMSLVDPGILEPEFVRAVRNIRFRGARAKVNLALDKLPNFVSSPNDPTGGGAHLRATISLSPSLDYLERAYDDAKHGRVSSKPYLEIRIPSLLDPSLAPSGKHVMSVWMQYAPYRLGSASWDAEQRDALGDLVVRTIAEYAPGFEKTILHRQVLTPKDLEDSYGLTEGSLSHGELALDQILFMRPVAGWSRYRTPVRDLYLCSAGTHPGGGITGGSGRLAAREILKDWKKKR